jgi:hypothetical protein
MWDVIYDRIRELSALFGGGTGLFYWWNRWRNRIRLTVSVKEHPDPSRGKTLQFEVINEGNQATALHREVTATLLDQTGKPAKGWPYGTKRRLRFFVNLTDRSLPCGTPRSFEAVPERGREVPMLWSFATYKFRPHRGSACRVRVRHLLDEPIGWLAFVTERAWSRIFGRLLRRDTVSSIEDWKAMEHRRGRHDRDA